MNELIEVTQEKVGKEKIKTVNARDLHSFLGAKKDFSDWIKDRISKYSFTENQDYVIGSPVLGNQRGKGGDRRSIDYHISLNMAKELSMVERTAKGKQARLYFIECEKVAMAIQPAYTLPSSFKEALLQLVEKVEQNELLQLTLTEQAPKVAFAESVAKSAKSIRIGEFVKIISSQEGFVIGRNNFFKWLRWEKMVDRKSMPFQPYIDNGWFEVRESTYENIGTNGPQVCFTTLITGKGQIGVLARFKKSATFLKYLNKDAKSNIILAGSQDALPGTRA